MGRGALSADAQRAVRSRAGSRAVHFLDRKRCGQAMRPQRRSIRSARGGACLDTAGYGRNSTDDGAWSCVDAVAALVGRHGEEVIDRRRPPLCTGGAAESGKNPRTQ
ncbi:MAG: hypothetical protein OHK0044_25950 [Burkholderiaceae bacterium]